jgi:DMSO/TMAO reductase YedYZ molybdopterin-dependent catalytic subunit
MRPSRRRFIAASAALGAAGWMRGLEQLVAAAPLEPLQGGRLVGTVPLGRFDGRPAPPFHVLLGSGLDARQFTDLSSLDTASLVTPNDRFFIRTSATPATKREKWTLQLGGRVARSQEIDVATLAPLVAPAGTHLLECAGNTDPANFGLMSVAQWDGVPIAAVLDRVQPQSRPWRVRVTGIDDPAIGSRTSQPGASWVFTRDDLEHAGAFLATRMNGAELPRDHGYPLRLVVPGWYGCACIKWVSAIDVVPDTEPVTTQMIEFARRTHQDGQPALARDYQLPLIDVAAAPVRIERWVVGDGTVYRVIGIVWGGSQPAASLSIRFRQDEPFVRVDDYKAPASTAMWSLWSHTWRPSAPGRYRIVLRNDDTSVRSRRLDVFFYLREVEIET